MWLNGPNNEVSLLGCVHCLQRRSEQVSHALQPHFFFGPLQAANTLTNSVSMQPKVAQIAIKANALQFMPILSRWTQQNVARCRAMQTF